MTAYAPTPVNRKSNRSPTGKDSDSLSSYATATAYVPPKPMKDSVMTEKPVVVEVPAKVAAYVPKHAAKDHAKINKTTTINIDPDHPLLRKVGILPSGNPTHAQDSSDSAYDSSDYENFLQAYRVAMTRVTMVQKSPTMIEVKPVRKFSIHDHDSGRVSYSSLATTPTSASRRGSLANSVFDKIGNYIKPPRRDSVHSSLSGRTSSSSPMSSRRGSAITAEDRFRYSQSEMLKEIGLVDRDALAIEKRVRDSWNSRISTPPSPNISRFSAHSRQ